MSDKQKKFHDSLTICANIESRIRDYEEQIKALKTELAQARAKRDAHASAAAEERHEAGFILLPMPDGTSCAFSKAKRRKGAEPEHKFVVRYDERFDAENRRIQTVIEE